MDVYNFSAGPSCLPQSVLKQAQSELRNWHNTGISVMEMSPREAEFISIANQAKLTLRHLLNIPDNYHILYLQGGARSQFAMVPLNLLGKNPKANYLISGLWGEIACEEARRYGDINEVPILSKESPYHFTEPSTWLIDPNATYTHVTTNETINGNENYSLPQLLPNQCIVADMSSTLLSRPFDVTEYDLIYACAQKNMGPSGVTFVIVRNDILWNKMDYTPAMFNYQNHIEQDSLYNTAPTFSLYIAGLVFEWLKNQGGLSAMAEQNKRQADQLYQYIDQSDFYSNNVSKSARSWMNVPFLLADKSKENEFLEQAKKAGLIGLKGHRFVGGMRASIYNAMPDEGIAKLLEFMEHYKNKQKQNGDNVRASTQI